MASQDLFIEHPPAHIMECGNMPEQRIRSPQCLHNIEDKFIDLSRSSSQHRNALMHMIKSCGKLKNLNKARLLHSQSKHLMPQDLYITVSVLTMLAKCGAMKEAVEIFEQIPKRTVVPWNSLISGHVQNGQPELAMKCFLQMQDEGVTPDSITLTCILKACGSLGSLEIGTKIHALIEEKGLLQQDVMLGNTLVNMYCKFGLIGKAHEILEQFPRRNVASWSALIAGYAQHGRGEEALRCFYSMQNEGISPDSVSFICILKACGSIGSLKIGEEIHDEVKKQGLLGKDIVLGTALVDMYAKCGALEKAHKVLEELPERNVVSWSALITGYVQHGHGDVAVKCFMEMLDEGISPDAVTFVCVLMACGSTGSLKVGQDIHAEVKEQNLLGKDMALGTTLLHMYAKCGVLNKAHEVFELLPQRDVVSWNALMDGHAQMGQVKTVFKLLNEIRLKRILPDPITFLIVLNACSHAGLIDEGQWVFNDMCNAHSQIPSVEHYTCMVDLFGRAGHFDRVKILLNDMPSATHLPLFAAVLGACRKWGNVELGRWAFEKLIALDSKCGAAYACMRNIYTIAGMHVDAIRVESQRRGNQTGNLGGCCWWIDGSGNVYSFVAGDKTHAQIVDVFSKLGNFQQSISHDGHSPSLGDKKYMMCGHNEKPAIACALINTPHGTPINIITKHTRICHDCHNAMALISKTEKRRIHVKDALQVHIFSDGRCICHDCYSSS